MNGNKEIQTGQMSFQIRTPDGVNILYSDMVIISTTEYGVVLDFAQSMQNTNMKTVVARIGVSREHAESIIKTLQDNIVNMQALESKK